MYPRLVAAAAGFWASLSLASVSACGTDVPEHDIRIVSNCNGEERSGVFHFEAENFSSCGEWDCGADIVTARQISGDLETTRVWLEGFEHSGASAYWVAFDRAEGVPVPERYDFLDFVECRWSTSDDHHDEVGERVDCFYGECWAELDRVQ
jgi:hypothetical protein